MESWYVTMDSYYENPKEHFSDQKTWVLLQFDTRPLNAIDKAFTDRNKSYCQKNGYEYRFLTSYENDTIPPYWVKVKAMKDIIEKENVSGVFWIDTDAVVYRPQKTLDSFFETNTHMALAHDPPWWGHGSFNAGVFGIKNTAEGKDILSKWWSKYDPSTWWKEGEAWKTSGGWADYTYEQGAFKNLLPTIRTFVTVVPWETFQEINPRTDGFSLHFSVETKDRRQGFLDTYTWPDW